MRIFIGLACLALVASASFVNKKLSKTNCGTEDGIECANGLDGCCPSYFPYCCPDNIWCTETLDACPPINTLNILTKKALHKKMPMVKTTSASYVPKKIEKTKKSMSKTNCEYDNECPNGLDGCCPSLAPYCCPDNIWCAETPDECPPNPIKKALPKRLPMGKITSASYVHKKVEKWECDPTEDNVCYDGKGCCGGDFPVCCPNNRCGARGDDC